MSRPRRLVYSPVVGGLVPLAAPALPASYSLSQAELDHEFVQSSVRRQTFLTFDLGIQPWLAPAFQAVERYAHAFQPGRTRHGIFIAGSARGTARGCGKSHLVHCLINQARALCLPALSLTLTQLLDLTVPERGETAAEREERHDRQCVLRQVPVLALLDLDRHDLSAAEIKELSLLLEYREDRGLVTHCTGRETPAQYQDRPAWGQTRDEIAALTRRLERLCDPILIGDLRASSATARAPVSCLSRPPRG